MSDNTVSAFTIDPSSGALSAAGTPASTGSSPEGVAVDPFGRFAYVAAFSSNNLTAYTIDPSSGSLTSAGSVGGEGGQWPWP